MATPASVSAIPGTIPYLFNLFATTYPMDPNNVPTFVWFGVQLTAFSAPTTIEINGVGPADQEPAEMGPNYKREETFSVNCRVSVFNGQGASGSTDFIARMTDCFTVWKALEIAVANDPTLGNNVRYAEFGDMEYEPTTDGSGRAMGCLTWCVRCSQRVTSLS
jgi:hypothetical protein